MVLDPTTQFTLACRTELSRSGVQPVYLVDLELGPMAYITVVDYTQLNAASITVTTNLGSVTGVEGVDWARGASNAAAALSIATTWLLYGGNNAGSIGVTASYSGAQVYLWSTDPTVNTITVSNSISGGYSNTPLAVPRTVSFLSNATPRPGYFNSLSSVSPISNKLDLITRKITIGQVELEFVDDGVLRDLIRRSRPKGKKVTIRIGCDAIAISDFAPVGVYVIDDFIPEPGKITLRCVEPLFKAMNSTMKGNFVDIHPLSAMADILSAVDMSPSFYNANTLDRTKQDKYGASYANLTHLAVSRHNFHIDRNGGNSAGFAIGGTINESSFNNGVSTPTKAADLLGQLASTMYASFAADETGYAELCMYDGTRATVRTLGDNDIDSLIQESSVLNLFNRLSVAGVASYWGSIADGNLNGVKFPLLEVADQSSLLASGESGYQQEIMQQIGSEWIGTPGYLAHTLQTSDTSLVVFGVVLGGFSGSRPSTDWWANTSGGAPSQLAIDQLNGTTRVAYLLISDGIRYEYVAATAFAYDNPYSTLAQGHFNGGGDVNDQYNVDAVPVPSGINTTKTTFMDPALTTHGQPAFGAPGVGVPIVGTYTVPSDSTHRGLFGSTWQLWTMPSSGRIFDVIRVFDVTIPVVRMQQALNRFIWGVPIVRITVPLIQLDLQLGDFINLTNDVFLNFNKDGADGATVFEVIGKEFKILEDTPSIELTCAWVRDDVAPTVLTTYTPPWTATPGGITLEPASDVVTSTFDPVTNIAGQQLTTG